MKVAFVANYDKTVLYHAIDKTLAESGHATFHIAPSHRWAKWLRDQGVDGDRILDLTQFGERWAKPSQRGSVDKELIASVEQAGDFTLRNVIMMDRLLSRRPPEYALAYLEVAIEQIRNFLLKHQVDLVVAESSWAIEMITSMVCAHLGVPFVVPGDVRIPPRRFGFFGDCMHRNLIPVAEVSSEHREKALEIVTSFRQTTPKPWYMLSKIEWYWLTRIDLSWPRRFVATVKRQLDDPYDETNWPVFTMGKMAMARAFNYQHIKLSKPFETFEYPSSRPFVLYALQIQPESSIDVLASAYTNQIELLRAMARTLPTTHDLVVKDHPKGVGLRSVGYYKQLKRIPGLKLIDPKISSLDLVRHADLVISPTGTICYEAAVLNKPSVTLVPMFFKSALARPLFCPYTDSLTELLNEVGRSDYQRDEPCVELVAFLLANSFEGIIAGSATQPTAVEADNVNSIVHALETLHGSINKS